MIDDLTNDLKGLGWKPAIEEDLSDVITFDIVCSGHESTDDGVYPEYEIILYEKFEDDEVERNRVLQSAVESAVPYVQQRAGTIEVEATISVDDRQARMTVRSLRERQ